MNKEVLKAIKEYDRMICNLNGIKANNYDYAITNIIRDEKEGAALYLFEGNGIESAAFAYDGGGVFLLPDWQGARPETLKEVSEYDWVTYTGRDAIIFNSYPRSLQGI